MINIDEINEEITKLENCDYTTYPVCQKLAILYTVRNNFKPNNTRAVDRTSAIMAEVPQPAPAAKTI